VIRHPVPGSIPFKSGLLFRDVALLGRGSGVTTELVNQCPGVTHSKRAEYQSEYRRYACQRKYKSNLLKGRRRKELPNDLTDEGEHFRLSRFALTLVLCLV